MRPGVDPGALISDSEAISGELVEPALPRPGVCSTCRTWADKTEDQCRNCAMTAHVLGHPALPLNVVSLYQKPSQLRDWMTGYKDSLDGSEPLVPEHQRWVRAILGRYLLEHGAALANHLGGIDAIVVVPSTTRLGPHPLKAIVDSLEVDIPTVHLLERGPGDITHRRPAPDGYVSVSGHLPMRVLLLDDVYTTGAHADSAAHALRTGGHQVAGLLALARRVNLSFRPDKAEPFWRQQNTSAFDWKSSPIVPA